MDILLAIIVGMFCGSGLAMLFLTLRPERVAVVFTKPDADDPANDVLHLWGVFNREQEALTAIDKWKLKERGFLTVVHAYEVDHRLVTSPPVYK